MYRLFQCGAGKAQLDLLFLSASFLLTAKCLPVWIFPASRRKCHSLAVGLLLAGGCLLSAPTGDGSRAARPELGLSVQYSKDCAGTLNNCLFKGLGSRRGNTMLYCSVHTKRTLPRHCLPYRLIHNSKRCWEGSFTFIYHCCTRLARAQGLQGFALFLVLFVAR